MTIGERSVLAMVRLVDRYKIVKKVKYFIVLLLMIAIAYVVSNPLYWPQKMMHWWLLNRVPLGSSESVLIKNVQKYGWTVHTPQRVTGSTMTMLSIDKNIDGTYVQSNLGSSWFVFTCTNEAIWFFDSTGKLRDVIVRKGFDAL